MATRCKAASKWPLLSRFSSTTDCRPHKGALRHKSDYHPHCIQHIHQLRPSISKQPQYSYWQIDSQDLNNPVVLEHIDYHLGIWFAGIHVMIERFSVFREVIRSFLKWMWCQMISPLIILIKLNRSFRNFTSISILYECTTETPAPSMRKCQSSSHRKNQLITRAVLSWGRYLGANRYLHQPRNRRSIV